MFTTQKLFSTHFYITYKKLPYILLLIFLALGNAFGQERTSDYPITDVVDNNFLEEKITALEKKKEAVIATEKAALKKRVLEIEKRLKRGNITPEKATQLKEAEAALRAKNIANRTAIIDLEIELLKRNNGAVAKIKTTAEDLDDEVGFSVNVNGKPLSFVRNNKYRYDIRTYSDLVVSMGINNLINFDTDLEGTGDFDYQLGGSRFLEIGWEWRTRLVRSNFLRLNYGISFQFNGLKPKNNQYIAVIDGETQLATFEHELRKSKFRVDNLVFPLHLEIGNSNKMVSENKMRYTISNSFRIGVGGYVGFNMSSRQKLKYTLNGERVKEKLKRGYDVSDLVYGLSAYAGRGGTQIYAKYDLNPMFQNSPIKGNNISLGLRFDL